MVRGILALLALGFGIALAGPEPAAGDGAAALARARELEGRIGGLYRTGAFAEALPLAEEALALRRGAGGPDGPEVGGLLSTISTLLMELGRYEEAAKAGEEALRVFEKALGPEDPNVAGCIANLGLILRRQGRFEEARERYDRALALEEKVLGRDHPEVAYTLTNLAELSRLQYRLSDCVNLNRRALAIAGAHPELQGLALTTRNNLASALFEQGYLAEAQVEYERVLAEFEAHAGGDHPFLARILLNLANVRDTRGLCEKSRHLCERAATIIERTLGPEHPDMAMVLTNLAVRHVNMGRFDAAAILLERALAIDEQALGEKHPETARALTKLASVLTLLDRLDTAEPLARRAVEALTPTDGPELPEYHDAVTHLGVIEQGLGRADVARATLERALAIAERVFGTEHPEYGRALENLATCHLLAGRYAEALPFAERSLAVRERTVGPDHRSTAESLSTLAGLLDRLRRLTEARPLHERALAIVETEAHRQIGTLEGPERLALVRALRRHLDGCVWNEVEGGVDAWPLVLRFKGLVARADTAERALLRRGGADIAAGIEDLRAAERRLSGLASSIPIGAERRAQWQERYAAEAAGRQKIAADLALRCAPLRAGLERLDIGVEQVQAALDEGDVLIDFLRANDLYYAWILNRTGDTIQGRLGTAPAVEAACAALAESAGKSPPGDPVHTAAVKAFEETVLAPLVPHLPEGAGTVYICPDAALGTVPFAALPALGGHPIVYLLMAQDLVPLRDAPPPGTGALLVGGVDYGRSAEEVADPTAARGWSFAPLPGTAKEVAGIAPRLGEKAVTLTGAQATEGRFREAARGRRILHLATHGKVRTDVRSGLAPVRGREHWLGTSQMTQMAGWDPMLLAGLAFAGASTGDGGGGDDGILTALEASNLDLDGTDLVVLSACETARGRAEPGEGILGLVAGFRMAGARRVVASLWPVDDETAGLFMQRFYEAMLRGENPLPPAQALREASLAVRAAHPAPRHWAAFVLYGR